MLARGKMALIIGSGIGAFALLLLIISAGTVQWLDGSKGHTVGLFRKCYGENTSLAPTNADPGCYNENRNPQAGLIVFGILLLSFGVIVAIAHIFLQQMSVLMMVALGLFYFASMFVMAAYATWGHYSRSPTLYNFPIPQSSDETYHTVMGPSYHLCVAAHYFLWTALTCIAFAAGTLASDDSSQPS